MQVQATILTGLADPASNACKLLDVLILNQD
jgi:hypothetical protein